MGQAEEGGESLDLAEGEARVAGAGLDTSQHGLGDTHSHLGCKPAFAEPELEAACAYQVAINGGGPEPWSSCEVVDGDAPPAVPAGWLGCAAVGCHLTADTQVRAMRVGDRRSRVRVAW
ncbi:hypothetical protein GCM10027215_03840 [Nocardioides zeae]